MYNTYCKIGLNSKARTLTICDNTDGPQGHMLSELRQRKANITKNLKINKYKLLSTENRLVVARSGGSEVGKNR